MTNLPKMTNAEAYIFYRFCNSRFAGWEVVERIKHHHRSNARQAANELFLEISISKPKFGDFVAAAMAGEPVHLLLPEHLQVEVERRLNTKVPRDFNEPTSSEFTEGMPEDGRTDYLLPDFLANHGREP